MIDFLSEGPSVDPDGMADLHPADFLERLKQTQPSEAGAGGDGWRGLIQMLAPVMGAIAMKGGPKQTGFMNGLSEGQQIVAQERQRRSVEQQRKDALASDFVMKIADKAQDITDPVAFDQFVGLAENAGVKAGYLQPGELKQRLRFPKNKLAEKQLKELTDQLAHFEKGGYNLDELVQSGAILQLKDGTSIPIGTALDMTRSRPIVNGKAVARPSKLDVSASTDYGRSLARYARGLNKSVDDLTSAEELAFKKLYGQADDKPAAPPSAGGVDAQFNDLVELWKESNPGKEVPANVRTRLRVQARKDIWQADDRAGNGPRDRFQIQPVTNPDGSTSIVRVNLETGESTRIALPAGVAGAGRPNESEHTSKSYLDRAVPSDRTSRTFEASLAGLGSQFDTRLPNLLRSEAGQRYRQAQDEFINAALRRESGAAIQPSEYTRYAQIYFVRPGDTAATIKQKQEARQRVIDGFRQSAGNLGKDEPKGDAASALAILEARRKKAK